jgi:hypothetical protein
MCRQDGNEAIWQMLNESAGWSAEAEDNFSARERPDAEQLPTAAAELIIKLVTIQDGEVAAIQDGGAAVSAAPIRWPQGSRTDHEPTAAEDAISRPGQPGTAELPTVAAELIIKLVAIQNG